jgi:hypothetical protein
MIVPSQSVGEGPGPVGAVLLASESAQGRVSQHGHSMVTLHRRRGGRRPFSRSPRTAVRGGLAGGHVWLSVTASLPATEPPGVRRSGGL